MANQEYVPFTGKLDAATEFEPFNGTLDGQEPSLTARVKQGVGRAVDSAQAALTDSPSTIAHIAAQQARNALPQTEKQQRMAQEMAPYVDAANKSEGVVDTVKTWGAAGFKRAGQLMSNPGEAGKMIAEQLPNSLPGLAGGFAGAKLGAMAGTAVAPGVGTVVGGILGGVAGGFAGGYGLEKGSAMLDQVQKEAQARQINLQDESSVAKMVAEKQPEFEAAAQRKGVGTAGTDAVLNVATMGLAGMGGRTLAKEAHALSASVKAGTISATDAATELARLQAANAARNTLGAKALRHSGVAGAEMAGEGFTEGVGQKYAYGSVDAGDVIDESLLGLGTGAAMAMSGKAFNKAAGIVDQDATTRSLAATQEGLRGLGGGNSTDGWTTSPGAADPASSPPGAGTPPPEAPDFTTSPGAAPERTGGMDYQRDIPTDGLSLVDAAAQDRARAATVDFGQADTTAGWGTSPGAAPPRVDGIDMGREFDTSGLELDNRLPSERMGINPNAGPLSRAATIAVDSTPAQEATFIGRTARDLQAYQPKTGIENDNVIDVQGRVVEDRAISTPRRIEQGGPVNRILAAKMARDAGPGHEVVAVEGGYAVQKTAPNQPLLPAPLSQSAINNGAGNVQNAAPAAGTQAQAAPDQAPEAARGNAPAQTAAVPAAGTGGVQAAGVAGVAPQSPPKEAPNGTQADQTQQAAPQRQEAPAQPDPAVVARPATWRKNAIQAGRVAKSLGIDPTGKRLTQMVAEIDAADSGRNQAQAPASTAQSATENVAPAPGSTRIGRDQRPLAEGGKPFKTRKAAGDAKKMQPMMRVVTVDGGYALADKTPAQLAAEAKASKRLSNANTSPAGEPIPAHAFIAAAGGLNVRAKPDMGIDGNPRVGNRTLFAGLGKGLTIERATEQLVENGYLSEGASHNDAYALIKKSLSQPQYNADGIERIAQAESDAQFEDYLAAQEEAAADGDTDPFGMADEFTAEELDEVGYTDADPALQAEVAALIAQAEAMDIDTYEILEDIARTYANATQDQYNAAAKRALEAAITRSSGDGGSVAAQAAPAAEPATEQGLNQPEAPAALELAAQTQAEAAARQDAQEQAAKAEAAAKRAEDAAAKAEDERKRIAQASVRAADRFELGQDPMDSLTGQGSMFDAPEPEQQAPTTTAPATPQPITRADAVNPFAEYDAVAIQTLETKETDKGVAMFSRSAGEDGKSSVLSKNGKFKGWPRYNAWTRAEYNDVVSLLPAEYRNDPHRREPLSPADRDARAAAALPQLNAGLTKRTFTVDQLGNIAVDARDAGVLGLKAAAKIADQHGLGIYVTGVQSGQIKLLQDAGFVSEAGLGMILQRAAKTNSAPMPTPLTPMGAPAYGAIMSYRPRGFSQVMFSFGDQDATRTPARKASDANLVATQQLVDGLTKNWTRAPEIIVARDMQDTQIPQSVRDYDQTLKSQGATGEARGFIYQGKVYLLADQLNGPHQIAEVLFHEVLGHYGLRRAFGKGLTPILQQVATMRRKEMQAKAKEYGLDLTNERDRLTAAEEILAEMAQATPEIGFVKRAIAVIRNWMRANVPGFQSLRLTDNDIIQKYLLPARGAVTRSKETGLQSVERAMAMFSRANGTSAWDAPEPSRFDALAYKMQDKHIDTKRVVESITKTVGQIKDSLNVYLQEELYHGRAARRVADFGGSELKPLLNQMRMAGLSLDDVEEYLHARHAKEANALIASREPGMPDGGSGMTNKAADDYMRNLPADQKRKLEAVAQKVDAITASTRQLYADYGLEDQKTVDGWGAMFANYVPLMREGKDGGMGIGQGFTVKGKEVKGRTGSTRKVVDILANIAAQREKVIVRGEKNRVATALVGLAAANPNPEFWEARSQPPTERAYDAKTDSVVDRPDSMFKQRANVVTAKVKDAQGNVTEQAVVFNEDDPRAMRMAAALKNLDAANLEGLLGVSAKITRYFSAVNTKYNPVFGVVNLVRDVQGAMVNLAATPLAGQQGKIAKDTMSALASIYQDVRAERSGKQATSKWSKLWAQMQEDGGTTGYRDLFATTADRANSLKNIIDPTAWADGPWGKVFTANGALKVPMTVAKQKAGVLFDWLSDYNDAMENGVRLAVYKAALDKGMSREQAASMAKNLTVNFNRKGQIGQQAGALYAFFNAAMQGTARMGQTLFDMDGGNVKTLRLSKTGKAVVYGGVTLGAIQALMLAGAGFDDEDPPEFVRERSLIIPTGGKTYVSIPMPLGLHVIPGIGRHATEFALSGFEKPAKRVVSMLGMLADAFNPIGNSGLSIQTIAPTVIDPLVALTENRDWTGKPIARVSSNKAIPGHSQWKDTATGMSKVIAEAINWISGGDEYVAGAFSPTPDQIDYLIAQVTGGVGREISKVEQAGKAALSGEELPTYKTPLLGRFYGNAEGQASEGAAFYANVDKLNEIETKVKAMRKDGKMAEASEYLRSKPEAVLIFQVNAAERRIQQLKRDKRELIEQDASREQVRAKEVQITEVMARLNRAAEAKSL